MSIWTETRSWFHFKQIKQFVVIYCLPELLIFVKTMIYKNWFSVIRNLTVYPFGLSQTGGLKYSLYWLCSLGKSFIFRGPSLVFEIYNCNKTIWNACGVMETMGVIDQNGCRENEIIKKPLVFEHSTYEFDVHLP